MDAFILRTNLQSRRAWVLTFGLFSVVLVATLVVGARAKPFWHDEVYTILHTRLPSLSAMWAANLDGLDTAPPLNAMITHELRPFVGEGPVATRVPAMIGYWVATLVVFEMVRRRSDLMAGLSGALLLCFTAAFYYAKEARAYGLLVGCFAVCLYAWSEAAAGRRRGLHLVLLSVALAAGLWNHYFGVLVLLPIGVGEAVRLVRDRRADWAMWAAIAVGLIAALPLVPLVRVAAGYAATYWGRARLHDALDVYEFLYQPLGRWRFAMAAVVIAVPVIVSLWRRGIRSLGWPRSLPAHEIAAGLTLLAVPCCAVVMAVYSTGAFVPRYAMGGVLGLPLVLPLAIWHTHTSRRAADLLLCLALLVAFGQTVYETLTRGPVPTPMEQRPLLANRLTGGDPVVLSGGLLYLSLWYYASPAARDHVVYLVEPASALRYLGSDTMDRNFLVLQRWAPVVIEPYQAFVDQHAQFDVYVDRAGWLMHKLQDEGAQIEEIGAEGNARMCRVVPRHRDAAHAHPPNQGDSHHQATVQP
jgi:hypothetical protein